LQTAAFETASPNQRAQNAAGAAMAPEQQREPCALCGKQVGCKWAINFKWETPFLLLITDKF